MAPNLVAHRGVDGAVPAHHDHRHRQHAGAPFLEQRDAVDVGHPDVQQHQVGRSRSRGARLRGVLRQSTVWPSSVRISDSRARMPSSSSTTRMIAMAFQCVPARGGRCDGGAMPSAGANFENDKAKLAPRSPAAPGARQSAGGSRATPGWRADARAVLVGDLLDHRQAQARALALGGDVGLEGALEHLVGEAVAVVDDLSGARRARRPRSVPRASVRSTHAAVAAVGHRVERVLHEVVDHLAQLRRVADDAAARCRARRAAARRPAP